ncbi:MAG TPA: hypothetical protein VK763_15395 [Terriglobales bacterium]|jgi:hypothetical protein|nr:hypothetical protein [Terriglobales bacterium]
MVFGDRLGLAGIILSLIALAAPYLWPDKKWIGWLSFSCAVLLLLGWGWLEFGAGLPKIRVHYPVLSTVAVFIIGGCLAVSLWRLVQPVSVSKDEPRSQLGTDSKPAELPPLGVPKSQMQPAPPAPEKRDIDEPPTLSDLFKNDFPNVLKMSSTLMLTREKDLVQIPIQRHVYMDFDAKTDFIGFYVPSSDQFSDETFQLCRALIDVVQPTILSVKEGKGPQAWGGYKGQGTKSADLVFSGRIFIYHEGQLSITQKAALVENYRAKGYDVQFRGMLDYGADQMAEWYRQHPPAPSVEHP